MNLPIQRAGTVEILIVVGVLLFNAARALMNSGKATPPPAPPSGAPRPVQAPLDGDSIPDFDDLLEALGKPRKESPPPVPAAPGSRPVPTLDRGAAFARETKRPAPVTVPAPQWGEVKPVVMTGSLKKPKDVWVPEPVSIGQGTVEVAIASEVLRGVDMDRIGRGLADQAAAMDRMQRERHAPQTPETAGREKQRPVSFARLRNAAAVRELVIFGEILGPPRGLAEIRY